MELPIDAHDIEYAEGYLAAGDMATALPLLKRLCEMAGEWADRTCADTTSHQWFAFDDAFERLVYRRVEDDPRELEQVDVPLGRLYSDLAFAYIRQQDYEHAREALMQAVRWNPMNCNYRLDLAELFRALGDKREWAALSFSVIERASDGKSAGRAYANLGQMFLDEGNPTAAAGCARLAQRLAPTEPRVVRLLDRLVKEAPDAANESDDHVMGELGLQGVPTQPNAEVAICLLMCATDAAAAGDASAATNFTVRARDLVGESAAKALIKLIRESDAEMEGDGAADAGDDAVDGAAAGDVDRAATSGAAACPDDAPATGDAAPAPEPSGEGE